MLGSVGLKALRDARRSLAWWSLGLAALVALIASVWPSVHRSSGLDRLVQQYPEALKSLMGFGGSFDYSTAAGYLGSELFSFMAPLVFLLAVIGSAAGAIAGEEERGTLELLLANPVSRRRVAAEKLAAVTVETLVLGLVLFLALWASAAGASMRVAPSRLAAATAALVLLTLAYGAVAFLLGAATGRRGRALAVTAALAVAAYLVDGLAPLVGALQPLQKATPFFHYAAGDPLRHGLSLGHAAILLAIAVVAGALSLPAFARRDLRL